MKKRVIEGIVGFDSEIGFFIDAGNGSISMPGEFARRGELLRITIEEMDLSAHETGIVCATCGRAAILDEGGVARHLEPFDAAASYCDGYFDELRVKPKAAP